MKGFFSKFFSKFFFPPFYDDIFHSRFMALSFGLNLPLTYYSKLLLEEYS